MSELASVGEFCPNDQCSDAGRTGADNIIRYGKTGNGRQRYRCRTCGKTSSETTGTVFSGKRTPKDEIIETLAFVAEGVRLASLSRVKGYKESTIRNWLRQAAEHAEEVEHALMSEYEVDRGQLDGLWSYVGENDKKEENAREESAKKRRDGRFLRIGSAWRGLASNHDRDRNAPPGRTRHCRKRERSHEGSLPNAETPPGASRGPPPTPSDTRVGAREAMIEVWGEVPEDTDGPGRPPTRKQPDEDWTLVQVVKEKGENGCVESVHKNIVFGAEDADQQFSNSIAQVERTHLTMRHMNDAPHEWTARARRTRVFKGASNS